MASGPSNKESNSIQKFPFLLMVLDFSNPVNLDHNTILNNIKAILPSSDTQMFEPNTV